MVGGARSGAEFALGAGPPGLRFSTRQAGAIRSCILRGMHDFPTHEDLSAIHTDPTQLIEARVALSYAQATHALAETTQALARTTGHLAYGTFALAAATVVAAVSIVLWA